MNGETEISLLQALLVYAWIAILIAIHYLAVLGRYGYPFKWRNLLIVFLIARIPIVGLVYYYWAYKGFGVWRRERSGGTKPFRSRYVLWGVIALVAFVVVVSLLVARTTPSADQVWRDKSPPLVEEWSGFALEQATRTYLVSESGEWCRIMEEGKATVDDLLSRWKALPNPQSPDLVEADYLFEESLEYLVASYDEAMAFCLDGNMAHIDRALLLVELSTAKGQEAGRAWDRYEKAHR